MFQHGARRQARGASPLVLAGGLLISVGCHAADPSASADQDYINPDRPGIADGSNVVGTGRFHAEIGLQYEYHRDALGHLQLMFLPTLLRLGLASAWELRLEGNNVTWLRSNEAGQITQTDGLSPQSIGVKYHFVDTAGASRPSVGAILRVFPPSGTASFHTHRTTADLRLAADWDFAPDWSLNPNFGVASYEDGGGHAFTPALFAMTLNYNPSPVLNLFVDTGMQSSEQDRGRAPVVVDGGVAYIVGHNVQLDASIGWGATGITTPRPFLAVGVSERF